MLRASVNNGFRTPSLQQRYSISTGNFPVRIGSVLVPTVRGLFLNDHEVAKALGIPSLTAEITINMSGGLTAKIDHRTSLTVDAYWIQIKNRVVLSGLYNRMNNRTVDSVLSRYSNLNQINQVSFFSNAVNTQTYGIDFVLNGFYYFIKSSLHYTLAANLNRTQIFGKIQTPRNIAEDVVNTNVLFNRANKGSIEKRATWR
jgi:iron complex outermembrane receptor protein